MTHTPEIPPNQRWLVVVGLHHAVQEWLDDHDIDANTRRRVAVVSDPNSLSRARGLDPLHARWFAYQPLNALADMRAELDARFKRLQYAQDAIKWLKG